MNKYLEKIAAAFSVKTNYTTGHLSDKEHERYTKEYNKNPRHLAAVGKAIVGDSVGSIIGAAGLKGLGPKGQILGAGIGGAIGMAKGWQSSKANTRQMALEKATKKNQD